MKVHTMIVTSAVIPIPKNWMEIPRIRVAVSVDGLPEHHNVRRHPATYDRILANIAGCQVNIHGTITHPMLKRAGYIEEYVSFWNARPEVVRIWMSTYTPQVGERSEEILTAADRQRLVEELLAAKTRYPKLLMNPGLAKSMLHPPSNPSNCLFSRMSVNYTADLKTRVEPCVFGGTPDCSRCGCAASTGLEWLKNIRLPLGVKIETIARTSMAIGALTSHFQGRDHVAAQARHG